jgi:hypothetical protein
VGESRGAPAKLIISFLFPAPNPYSASTAEKFNFLPEKSQPVKGRPRPFANGAWPRNFSFFLNFAGNRPDKKFCRYVLSLPSF